MSFLENKKVAILYGGVSDEREVSLASGQNAYDALSASGVDVELIDTRDGREALRRIHRAARQGRRGWNHPGSP